MFATPVAAEFLEEVLGENRDVLRALPQRRHFDRDHVQAKEEVLAEALLADGLLEVLVGGSDHPNVGLQGLRRADGLEGLFLEDAQQLHLEIRAHVADFVEEDRAPVRDQRTCPSRFDVAFVKAPLTWPKSSDSSSSSGIAPQLTATSAWSARRLL